MKESRETLNEAAEPKRIETPELVNSELMEMALGLEEHMKALRKAKREKPIVTATTYFASEKLSPAVIRGTDGYKELERQCNRLHVFLRIAGGGNMNVVLVHRKPLEGSLFV